MIAVFSGVDLIERPRSTTYALVEVTSTGVCGALDLAWAVQSNTTDWHVTAGVLAAVNFGLVAHGMYRSPSILDPCVERSHPQR